MLIFLVVTSPADSLYCCRCYPRLVRDLWSDGARNYSARRSRSGGEGTLEHGGGCYCRSLGVGSVTGRLSSMVIGIVGVVAMVVGSRCGSDSISAYMMSIWTLISRSRAS